MYMKLPTIKDASLTGWGTQAADKNKEERRKIQKGERGQRRGRKENEGEERKGNKGKRGEEARSRKKEEGEIWFR